MWVSSTASKRIELRSNNRERRVWLRDTPRGERSIDCDTGRAAHFDASEPAHHRSFVCAGLGGD
jgi:hypothetical protein